MRGKIALGLALMLAACSFGKDIPAAEQGVKAFHERLDADQIGAILAASGPDLTAAPSAARFTQLLTVVRKKLGRLKDTKQVGWNEQLTPRGQMISLNYQSHYERGDAGENFVFRTANGKPVLAGYHVNSDALILN